MGRHRIASRKRLVAIASAGVIVGALAAWVTPSFAAGSCATSDIVCHFSYTNSLIQSNGKKLDKLQQSVNKLLPSSTPTSPSPSPTPSSTPTPTPTPSPTPSPTQTTPPPSSTWPGASNTGVPAGTQLTNSGAIVANTDGQVIDGKNITGTITVRAKNVVIKNSKINAGTEYWGIEVDSGSATIEDSEITGSAAGAVWGTNYTLLRDNIHAFHGDGMKLGDNVTVQDNWIHDATTQGDQHCDGMQLEVGASNVVIRHNNVDPNEDGSNSAVFIKNDLGPNNTVGPVVVDHNLLGGGGFTLYVYKGSSGLAQGGVSVTNNRFLRDGYYGPVATNIPVATWSGNVYDDNAATISP